MTTTPHAFDFGYGDAAANARLHLATQVRITAAQDQVTAVVVAIGDNPLIDVEAKIARINAYGKVGEELLNGTFSGILPAPSNSPLELSGGPTDEHGHTADQRRIVDQETVIEDMCHILGLPVIMDAGKHDISGLAAKVQQKLDDIRAAADAATATAAAATATAATATAKADAATAAAAAATAAATTPANMVAKADVLADVDAALTKLGELTIGGGFAGIGKEIFGTQAVQDNLEAAKAKLA